MAPGFGQIYTGQLKKGLCIYSFLIFGFLILFRMAGVYFSFYSLAATILLVLMVQIYAISNAFLTAKRHQSYIKQKYNRWYVYAGLYLVALAVYASMPSLFERMRFGTHMFTITTPSMEPTLQVGDHIVANLSIRPDKLERGDIVMFSPKPHEFWISRVVALPGDLFEMKNDFLFINGKASKIRELPTKYIDYEPHLTFEETFPGGRTIQIHKIDHLEGRVHDVPARIIPADSVMLISDNRDNALDSRYIGPVNKADIAGKIAYTWWGKKLTRIGIDLTQR
ncbi:signal peptidase I [Spirosoma koreense]